MGCSNETNLRLLPYEQKGFLTLWKDEIVGKTSVNFGMFSQLTEWSVPYLDIFHIWKRNANLQGKSKRKEKNVVVCFYSSTSLCLTSCQT